MERLSFKFVVSSLVCCCFFGLWGLFTRISTEHMMFCKRSSDSGPRILRDVGVWFGIQGLEFRFSGCRVLVLR